uniref:DUF1618 domain-containing protein n=1 Tax=Setaria italica TaxID=4555 RepID=K3ZCS7_SETIT
EDNGLSPSSVLLDTTAYISAAAISNATTAVGEMSTGAPIHISFCLARPPRLSYITHANLALLRVPLLGALDLVTNHRHHDYFVYQSPGASSFNRLPHPHPKGAVFQDNEVAIFRCSGTSHYVIAGLRNTVRTSKFRLQRYDSDTGSWTSTLLSVHAPVRDEVLPIPLTATELLFHETTKVITLGGPRVTIGWVDLWRGILHCDVLDEEPVLRDVPLPKPSRANRRSFCRGGPHRYREIVVVTLPGPGKDMPPSRQSVDTSDDSGSDDGAECDLYVAPYWNATIWTMPVPVTSWKDWHKDKDCKLDVLG